MWAIVALVLFTPGATGNKIPESLFEGPAVIDHFDTSKECNDLLQSRIEDLETYESAIHQTNDLRVFGVCWNMTPITRS